MLSRSYLLPILLTCAGRAFSQMVNISYPAPGQNLTAGKEFLMQIESLASLTSFHDISIAVGMLSCATVPCENLTDPYLGNLLFAGNFTPKRTSESLPPYANYTLTVPETFTSGEGLLTVAHFYLIGASMEPILETKNISVLIDNPKLPDTPTLPK